MSTPAIIYIVSLIVTQLITIYSLAKQGKAAQLIFSLLVQTAIVALLIWGGFFS